MCVCVGWRFPSVAVLPICFIITDFSLEEYNLFAIILFRDLVSLYVFVCCFVGLYLHIHICMFMISYALQNILRFSIWRNKKSICSSVSTLMNRLCYVFYFISRVFVDK